MVITHENNLTTVGFSGLECIALNQLKLLETAKKVKLSFIELKDSVKKQTEEGQKVLKDLSNISLSQSNKKVEYIPVDFNSNPFKKLTDFVKGLFK